MTSTDKSYDLALDSERDLVLIREVDVSARIIWMCWTQPQHILPWFCPKPWSVASCEVELWPGGKFNTVMRSPEGELMPNQGCFLHVEPERKLIFTDALTQGFRPAEKSFFTGMILLDPITSIRTRYTAIARHNNPETAKQHEAMGFTVGWGLALDQLVEYASTLPKS